jgi:hypothetical protein
MYTFLALSELFKKYVQKRKSRANFIRTVISTSQGAKGSLVVILKQVSSKLWHDRPMKMQCLPKSLLVPPKFSYVTNCSSKPSTCSPIPLPWDIKHCSLVVMLGGGISYLITIAKLMQNWGYVYLVCLIFQITLLTY